MIIDFLVLIIPIAAFQAGFPFVGPVFMTFLYYPIFHASPIRATPGKRAMNIEVVSTKGETLSIGMAMLRHLFTLGGGSLFLIGHGVALITAKKQAVHDLVADSIVVKGRNDSMTTIDAWTSTLRNLFSRLN